MNPRLKMSNSGCTLVRHFQRRVHHISMSTHYRASSVYCGVVNWTVESADAASQRASGRLLRRLQALQLEHALPVRHRAGGRSCCN